MSNKDIILNPDQEAAVMYANMGSSLFITGGGGRGKSVIIDAITNDTTLVIAPTAQAAINVGGKTLHSAFKITPKKVITPTSKTFAKLKDIPTRLIIDEIGMVRSDYLDYVDRCLRRSTGVKKPFGGIQVIMAGDFFQLPPIVKPNERHLFEGTTPYAFSSKVWSEMQKLNIVLTKSQRQGNDEHIRILDEIRVGGERTALAVRKVNIYATQYVPHLHSDVTTLCFRNYQADNHNAYKFRQLEGESRYYKSEVDGSIGTLARNLEGIELKVGAKVIITANKYDRAVSDEPIHYNGQQGQIISLGVDYVVVLQDSNSKRVYVDYSIKEFYDINSKGERVVVGTVRSLPIKLGWAITTHASQGMTLDNAVLDTSGGAFETGLLYVMISRIKSLDNIILKNAIRVSDVKVDRRVIEFYNNL